MPIRELAAGISIGLATQRFPAPTERTAGGAPPGEPPQLPLLDCLAGRRGGEAGAPAGAGAGAGAADAAGGLPPGSTGSSDAYGRHALLTDIQGSEDHLGDMDLKVGGRTLRSVGARAQGFGVWDAMFRV